MTKFIASMLAAGALATTAFAAGGLADMDTNGDGLLTVEEVQAVYPEMTAEQFSAIDVNGDGVVDDAEMSAAQEMGLIPASDS
ncbi:EF-hand domain-containing protein [Roseovarius sp. M141]|uniref:EF-hand domain-containing protein n=1 Tax=Roseovarius sp. M141 TaxID=2583806 RepID=UPI0020CE6996|nr:EF-hand domain-containing protein [Roseovarius sp. M141]MCQ0092759.1 EF-hand domain-containing protein [Roseovarius sp. M141]